MTIHHICEESLNLWGFDIVNRKKKSRIFRNFFNTRENDFNISSGHRILKLKWPLTIIFREFYFHYYIQ